MLCIYFPYHARVYLKLKHLITQCYKKETPNINEVVNRPSVGCRSGLEHYTEPYLKIF